MGRQSVQLSVYLAGHLVDRQFYPRAGGHRTKAAGTEFRLVPRRAIGRIAARGRADDAWLGAGRFGFGCDCLLSKLLEY